MSSKNIVGKEGSVAEQAFEKADEVAVEQETQAKVDANHPDGITDTSEERIHGVTLEQEERIQAREAELEYISVRAELGTQDGREQRTREIAARRSIERRMAFQKRAASVRSIGGSNY